MIQQFEFDGEIYSEADFAVDFANDTTGCTQDNQSDTLPGTTIRLNEPYELIGISALPTVKTSVSGYNCDFVYRKVQGFDHVIHLLDNNSNKIMLKITKTESECFSGWTTATFVSLEVLSKGVPITHRNRKVERVTWIQDGSSYHLINNTGTEIVSITITGDQYYPSDNYHVNLDYFKLVNPRVNSKPTVYVVVGNSGIGKSLLVSKFAEHVKVWDFDAGMPKGDDVFEVYVIGGKASNTSEVSKYLDNLKDKYKLVKVALSDF